MKLRSIHRFDMSDISWMQSGGAADDASASNHLRLFIGFVWILVTAEYLPFFENFQFVRDAQQVDTLLDLETRSPPEISQSTALDDLEQVLQTRVPMETVFHHCTDRVGR